VLLRPAAVEILPESHHTHPARFTLLCTTAGAGFVRLVVGLAADQEARAHGAAHRCTNRYAISGAAAQCVCR
jgi:hypothetical protein